MRSISTAVRFAGLGLMRVAVARARASIEIVDAGLRIGGEHLTDLPSALRRVATPS
jgi:hypothetical protein